jgi:trehalose 6-phosphate synthase
MTGRRTGGSPNASFQSDWSRERLRTWLKTRYRGESIIVLANREPFRHDRAEDGGIVWKRSSGGLVTALEPLVHACSGVWIAHGAGSADKLVVDKRDGVAVPPGNPRYRLRRVWLNAGEERGYYYGFANEGLWPLCHRAHVQPVFRSGDFNMYRSVNARFADAVHKEIESERPLVLVQDYHFALAPRMIRERFPSATIIAFWHIPWPNPRDFAICPWGTQLLEGLLGSTIIGFQTTDDCRKFIETVERTLDTRISRAQDVVEYKGRRTTVRAYPVSVEWPNRFACQSPPIQVCRASVRRQLGLPPDVRLGVGVDRLDYTKGINEKLLVVEQFLDSYPEFREQFAFVQIAEPSRECLPAYRDIRARVLATADRINRRFATDRFRPIIVRESRHEPVEVYRFLRAADVCYVGSLHDGMNLVAKEFVSARDDERGVLIVSQFAGAARELTAASIVNPYSIDDSVQALVHALTMPDEEQARRMRAMRSVVAEFNTFRWAGAMLADAAGLCEGPGSLVQHDQSRRQPQALPA